MNGGARKGRGSQHQSFLLHGVITNHKVSHMANRLIEGDPIWERNHAAIIVSFVILIFLTIAFCIGVSAFVYYRHFFPVNARPRFLYGFLAFWTAVYILLKFTEDLKVFPGVACRWIIVISGHVFNLTIASLLFQSWKLFMKAKISEELLSVGQHYFEQMPAPPSGKMVTSQGYPDSAAGGVGLMTEQAPPQVIEVDVDDVNDFAILAPRTYPSHQGEEKAVASATTAESSPSSIANKVDRAEESPEYSRKSPGPEIDPPSKRGFTTNSFIRRLKTKQQSTWFQRHRALSHTNVFKYYACAISLILWAMFALLMVTDERARKTAYCSGESAVYQLLGLCMMQCVVFAILSYKNSKMRDDNIGLKRESLSIAWSCGVSIATWMLWQGIGGNANYYMAQAIFPQCCLLICVWFCFIQPSYRAYLVKKEIQPSNVKLLDLLQGKNPALSQEFFEYMSCEFSTENFLFWQDVQDVLSEHDQLLPGNKHFSNAHEPQNSSNLNKNLHSPHSTSKNFKMPPPSSQANNIQKGTNKHGRRHSYDVAQTKKSNGKGGGHVRSRSHGGGGQHYDKSHQQLNLSNLNLSQDPKPNQNQNNEPGPAAAGTEQTGPAPLSEFSDLGRVQDLQTEMKELYEMYIDSGGARQVNVSSATQRLLVKTLDELEAVLWSSVAEKAKALEKAAGVLHKAQAEVFRLIESDTFQRFVNTLTKEKLQALSSAAHKHSKVSKGSKGSHGSRTTHDKHTHRRMELSELSEEGASLVAGSPRLVPSELPSPGGALRSPSFPSPSPAPWEQPSPVVVERSGGNEDEQTDEPVRRTSFSGGQNSPRRHHPPAFTFHLKEKEILAKKANAELVAAKDQTLVVAVEVSAYSATAEQ
eukprot:g66541.t1